MQLDAKHNEAGKNGLWSSGSHGDRMWASMGLGRSCAAALAVEGVKVVIVARRREVLERTAAEIRSATGAEIVAVAADAFITAGAGARAEGDDAAAKTRAPSTAAAAAAAAAAAR